MPTILDQQMIPKAVEIIAKYGRDYTIDARSRTQDVSGRTVYGSEPPVIVKGSPPINYNQRYVDGDVVRATDFQVILPARDLTFEPTVGMRVGFDDVDAQIVSVTPYYSGELVCAFGLQVRG